MLDGPQVVARHERAAGKYAEILTPGHYLEVLKYKPGALPGATALTQAKAAGAFTPIHQRYWDAAPTRKAAPPGPSADRGAARPPHPARRRPDRGDDQGDQLRVLDSQVVVIDARRHAAGPVAPVIPIGALARYDRPAPTLTGYDELLTRSAP